MLLHKYFGGLGVEPPREKEAKKNGNLMKKKLEIKDGISLPPKPFGILAQNNDILLIYNVIFI